MNIEKVASRDGKAFETNEVKVKQDYYIDARYELSLYPRNKITPTGLLTVGELKPKDNALPRFLLRWDERAKSLDVDINNVSREIKRMFKVGKRGYEGHHTMRVPDAENRIFEVNIKIPGITVFKGEISFGLHRELEVTVNLEASVSGCVEKKWQEGETLKR